MKAKKLKIFIGFSEIANFVNSYRKGFEALGHDTFTVVGYRNKYYPNAHYDVVLSEVDGRLQTKSSLIGKFWQVILRRAVIRLYFIKALFSCDVFYYITGGNVLPFHADYFLIRLLRKKVVVVFLGSEIRHWYLYKLEMEQLGYAELFASGIEAYRNQTNTYITKQKRVKSAEYYANLILSQPGFAQLQSKPYCRATVGLYLPEYDFKVPCRKIPTIVHAPSARGVKGTEYVVEALDKLKAEGVEFDFKLIENMPNSQLIQLLVNSDIVIDELNSDTIGVLSTEAMATGNAVLTGYIAELVKVPLPCPAVNTNRLSIYANVKKLIEDVEYRSELAHKGRVYVEMHHDILNVAAKELQWIYTEEYDRKYDFVPTFDNTVALPEYVLAEEKLKGK